MLAIFGYGAQAILTGEGPWQNLKDHLSNPVGSNLVRPGCLFLGRKNGFLVRSDLSARRRPLSLTPLLSSLFSTPFFTAGHQPGQDRRRDPLR